MSKRIIVSFQCPVSFRQKRIILIQMLNEDETPGFEWSEDSLSRLSELLPSWRKNPKSTITFDGISLPIRFGQISNGCNFNLIDEYLNNFFCQKFDGSIDLELFNEYNEEKVCEEKFHVSGWLEKWSRIADRLSISYIDLVRNRSQFRKIKIIPHITPIIAIAHLEENDIIIIYGETKDEIDMITFLRHAYSNIPDGSTQIFNFLSRSLLDIHSQLYERGILQNFEVENFKITNSLWLQYDIFNPILELLNTKKESTCEFKGLLGDATDKWVHRKIDNFEYLTILNRLSGRDRSDDRNRNIEKVVPTVQNHPIFPWVCDFSSENGGFRPLNRTKYRLTKGDDQLREMFKREPSHHVPELLSDIGYMVYRSRIESKENLCKYVRRKWVPEEYPSTMVRMYQWTPDECIPDFYDDPSIFVSIHGDMSDLQIPNFLGSPADFIKWHRDMLESEEVSLNLHRWIDLIFGYLLSVEESKNAYNLHLCFVEKKKTGLRTNGMVKLFDRPHPTRMPINYNAKSDFYNLYMESYSVGNKGLSKNEEVTVKQDGGFYESYQQIKRIRNRIRRPYEESMLSVIRLISKIVLSPHVSFFDSDLNYYLKKYNHTIPNNYRLLFEFLLVEGKSLPFPDEFSFYVNTLLNIPSTISDFYEEFTRCSSYNILRNSGIITQFSKRSQIILLREVESLKKAIRLCHHTEICVVAAFQKLLGDDEASIQAVHKLMPVIARNLSQSSLEDLINPMIELMKCETSVKLLDRRFLQYVSICYGTGTFLDLFLPPIIEAAASRNDNRSIVAKESILWLAKRYRPVICAKFISSNLLRIMAACFEGLEVYGDSNEIKSVFHLTLCGEETCSRIELILSEIVVLYSPTFITVQFLPFCVDLIEQYSKRPTFQMEASVISTFRIVAMSIRSMSDHQVLNYIEDIIIEKIISRIFHILLDGRSQFSSSRNRNIILCKALQLLYSISKRIGAENTRIYAMQPFKLLFSTFSALYETDNALGVNEKAREENDTTYLIPIWIVKGVIDNFAKEWGVPFMSSFCSDPSFLIPFVSSTNTPLAGSSTAANSPPSHFGVYSFGSLPSGNRLFSLSSSSQISSSNSLGGLSICDSGSLSSVWCARVSAAVCGSKAMRFDHLSMCTFPGHSERIRKLASMSNENSFVSASSDKTVKLWSIKPELDDVDCQWTYKNHSKSVSDVTILADNLIASTDGALHVWDPFRGTMLAQLDWDSEGNGGNIMGIANVERHTLAAISSLHSTVKLFDTRVGEWTSELKVSPSSGITRAIAIRDSGRKLAVALSNGSLAIMDARNGKINALAQMNSTHTVCINWINNSQLLICDADESGVVMETSPRAQIVKKLPDSITAATIRMNTLVTLQNNSMLRIYKDSAELMIETRIRPDELPGNPTAILPLSLNSAFLIGSNQGAIRLMC